MNSNVVQTSVLFFFSFDTGGTRVEFFYEDKAGNHMLSSENTIVFFCHGRKKMTITWL